MQNLSLRKSAWSAATLETRFHRQATFFWKNVFGCEIQAKQMRDQTEEWEPEGRIQNGINAKTQRRKEDTDRN
jgi:hypothetical protein